MSLKQLSIKITVVFLVLMLGCVSLLLPSQKAGAATTVTLTLYVHEGSAGGQVIIGAQVTCMDGGGNYSSYATNSGGYVTITGVAGTWSFGAAAAGYEAVGWAQSITSNCRRDAFLSKSPQQPSAPQAPTYQAPTYQAPTYQAPTYKDPQQPSYSQPPQMVVLTLYVHEGNSYGNLLQGALVTGYDGGNNSFYWISGPGGFVTITGVPGDWQFTAAATGYETVIWTQPITYTCRKDASLPKIQQSSSSYYQAPQQSPSDFWSPNQSSSGSWSPNPSPSYQEPSTTDVYWLARTIMSEASVGTREERIAVGWTILNRYYSGAYGNSIKQVVTGPYATNQDATPVITTLANDLLEGKISDPTGGATNFFSPRGMPQKGEPTYGYDVRGGLHEVPGTSQIVYYPSFAKPKYNSGITAFYQTTSDLEWVSGLTNVRNWYYMFYRPNYSN